MGEAERLDIAMVRRSLAPSRERAQLLIRAGAVLVDGVEALKPAQPVTDDMEIVVVQEVLPYVSRGGAKLEAALRHFRINVQGARCLDVGASTGGFTDCLLQRGARRVVCVDVGHGQLHEKLRKDPRVELHEGVNARYLSAEVVGTAFDLIAVDVSYISATLVLPALVPLLRPGGFLIVLIKPEFEAGRDAVGLGGVVRSDEGRRRARERVSECAVNLGLRKIGVVPSPIRTGRNREYLGCFRSPKEVTDPCLR